MLLLDKEEIKVALKEGGSIGPEIRRVKGGARLAGMTGIDIPVKKTNMGTSSGIFSITEHQEHLVFSIQLTAFKYTWLVIPKNDVLEWGVLDRGSMPGARTGDQSSAIAGFLLYGPIGLLVGSSMDKAAAKKQADKPVIGIAFRNMNSEAAIFVDFQIASWYYNLHDFLKMSLPEKLKE